MEAQIFATFQEDIRQNFLICHPLPKNLAAGAVNLLSVLADVLATANRIMAAGGKGMGFSVVQFD
jgi:hypothetical protein